MLWKHLAAFCAGFRAMRNRSSSTTEVQYVCIQERVGDNRSRHFQDKLLYHWTVGDRQNSSQLPTSGRPTFLPMMNVFYPFVPICLFAFLPSADCTTELLCRKEVQQLMAGWWDLLLCTWRLAANAVSAAVGFPLRCVFHEFDSHWLNVPVGSAVQISWLLGHLLLYANDISFFIGQECSWCWYIYGNDI